MRPRVSVFIATSLDGFIAREEGDIDWLIEANQLAEQGEDCGYKAFMSSIDMMVMGRLSYEKVLTFDEWPYADMPVTVLSSRSINIPEHLKSYVTQTSDAPKVILENLAKKDIQHIYIDGGLTIQSFLKAGLVDEITLTLIPILIGSGKRLFGELDNDLKLKLLSTSSYAGGFVQMRYRVLNK